MPGEAARRQLDESGYLILTDFMPSSLLAELRDRVEALWAEEGADAGAEFKREPGTRRLANLVNKGEVFTRLILMPDIVACVEHVLGPGCKLSSLNARSANPYNACAQPLHADTGAIADECGYKVCNTVWMLDAFTPDNGALRLIPGSHQWRRLPPPGTFDPLPGEQLVTGAAGTVAIMNAHVWHGGSENRTGAPRRAIHAFYARHDQPQQQYQKALLSSAVQAQLPPAARRILALDDEENDRLSSAVTRMSGFLK